MADSQVIMDVAAQTPEDIPLTTFSIQMAYSKADVIEMARGTAALASLEDGDRVLICETCSHHPQKDDIGRIKIPRSSPETGQGPPDRSGRRQGLPRRPDAYKVLIQCGGCVVTRRHMLMRLRAAHAQNVPMTNYGLTIRTCRACSSACCSATRSPQGLQGRAHEVRHRRKTNGIRMHSDAFCFSSAYQTQSNVCCISRVVWNTTCGQCFTSSQGCRSTWQGTPCCR